MWKDHASNVPKCRLPAFFYFIGNCVFGAVKKERMFIERTLDKHAFGYDNKTLAGSEDIETFFAKTIVKWIIFI